MSRNKLLAATRLLPAAVFDFSDSCCQNESSCPCVAGINRALPAWERSRTEEDILRAALRPGGKQMNSGPTSASEDSNALEWENDFVSTHPEDNADTEFEGFVNPVLDTPSEDASDRGLRLDSQDR